MNLHLLLVRCLCDYRCVFCTMGSTGHVAEREANLADMDPVEEWERIEQTLRGGVQDPGDVALHIMGNDPINHPDLGRAVRLAAEVGFQTVVLETNGLKLEDPAFSRQLVDAGVRCFKLPIYGSRAEVHDAIVRLPGAFDRLTRALENLAKHPVEVQLHSLILKQNADDLPRCDFPYPLSFRYPFRHDQADFPYEHYAPRLADVPSVLLFRSDLVIPCINGRRNPRSIEEARVRPDTLEERHEDTNVVQRRPDKCTPETCLDFGCCQGIYPVYYQTYGDDEFAYERQRAAELRKQVERQRRVRAGRYQR